MTNPIYANGAASKLSQPLGQSDLVVYVDDTSNFPKPTSEEHFLMTLAGACSNQVEIVMASSTGDGQITLVQRGLEGTTAKNFVTGDMVYAAVTAAEFQLISQSYRWYLGPHEDPPIEAGPGMPLLEGHYYYNTTTNTMMVWTGSQWVPFGTPGESYLTRQVYWAELGPFPADTPLPTLDVYGNSIPVPLDPNLHLVRVELNGVHLIEEINAGILAGDYTIDYPSGEVTPKAEIPTGATVVVTVHINSGNQVYMEWLGDWVQQTYLKQQVVRDGDWTMVALIETADRAAPTTVGAPEYSVVPDPIFPELSNVSLVKSGQTYTFTEDGWLENIRVWVPEILDHSFRVILEDVTNSVTREITLGPITPDAWNVVTEGNAFVQAGNVFKITLETSHDTGGAAEYVEHTTFWSAPGSPLWAAAVGHLSFGGTPEAGKDNAAYGIDVQFQQALISPDWDVVASTGNSAAGGAGSIGLHNDLTGRDTEDSHPQTAITDLVADQAAQDALIAANTASLTAPTDGDIYGRQGDNWVPHNALTVITANTNLTTRKSYYDDGNNLTHILPEKATLVEPAGLRIAKGDGGGVTTLEQFEGGTTTQLFWPGDYAAFLLIGGKWVLTDESVFAFTDVFLSADQFLPDNNFHKALFDTVRRDTMNAFANSEITIPLTGLYGVTVHSNQQVSSGVDNISEIRVTGPTNFTRIVDHLDDPPLGNNDANHSGYFELEILATSAVSYWVIIQQGTDVETIHGDLGGTQTTISVKLLKQYDITA